MPLFPESEPRLPVSERPDIPEIPPEIERAGVKPVPSQYTQVVKSDSGQVLTNSQATTSVSINIPSDQANLISLSKGDTNSSITWFGAFWLRMIKKAIHFGWKMIFGNASNS